MNRYSDKHAAQAVDDLADAVVRRLQESKQLGVFGISRIRLFAYGLGLCLCSSLLTALLCKFLAR